MSNIKAISKLAGVSIATVSRVLNNYPYVKIETRQAVEDAIKKLNYTPNSSAIHLRHGKTYVIGVIVPFVNHPFFSMLIQGIGEASLLHDYDIILLQQGSDKSREIEHLSMLKNKRVDGLILTSSLNTWETINDFMKYGPIISCEKIEKGIIPSVFINHFKAFYEGIHFLLKRGYKNIAICPGPAESAVSMEREQGYIAVLKELNLPNHPEWIFREHHSIKTGKEIMNLVMRMDNQPDALITGSDEVAAGVLFEAKENNISIPNDFGILGFDNQPISELLNITTIEQPIKDIGKSAMELLIKMINNKKNKLDSIQTELPFNLIERRST